MRQLSSCATATELELFRAGALQLWSPGAATPKAAHPRVCALQQKKPRQQVVQAPQPRVALTHCN